MTRSLALQNIVMVQQSDKAKIKDLLTSQFEGGSIKLDELMGILREEDDDVGDEAEGSGRKIDPELEEELQQIVREASEASGGAMAVEEFLSLLLHPKSKGTGSALDTHSINLAQ